MPFIQAIAIVLIRLWAASMIFSSISTIGIWLDLSGMQVDFSAGSGVIRESVRYSMISAAGMVAVGFGAWIFASPIAAFVVPGNSAAFSITAVSTRDLATLGTFLIGVFHLVHYLPRAIVGSANILVQISDRNWTIDAESTLLNEPVMASWIIVAVALIFTFRPGDIARMFVWLRHAHPRPDA